MIRQGDFLKEERVLYLECFSLLNEAKKAEGVNTPTDELFEKFQVAYNKPLSLNTLLREAEIKAFFLKAINKLVGDKKGVLEELEVLRQITCNTESLKAEEAAVASEMESIYKDSEKMISRNATAAQDQAG